MTSSPLPVGVVPNIEDIILRASEFHDAEDRGYEPGTYARFACKREIATPLYTLGTGFFLAVALMEVTSPHKSSAWILPLAMAFSSAVGVLQTTLLALHNCRKFAAT
jgi:hypothetical protein